MSGYRIGPWAWFFSVTLDLICLRSPPPRNTLNHKSRLPSKKSPVQKQKSPVAYGSKNHLADSWKPPGSPRPRREHTCQQLASGTWISRMSRGTEGSQSPGQKSIPKQKQRETHKPLEKKEKHRITHQKTPKPAWETEGNQETTKCPRFPHPVWATPIF